MTIHATAIKPPRKCQHCSGTIEGGGFVIVGGGVMHHECFRDAMTSAKATKFITTAVVPGGTVEISANTERARLQARLIIEGHKANLDRIAELEAQLAAEQRLRDEIAVAAGVIEGEAILPHVRRVVAERDQWKATAQKLVERRIFTAADAINAGLQSDNAKLRDLLVAELKTNHMLGEQLTKLRGAAQDVLKNAVGVTDEGHRRLGELRKELG